MRTESLASSQSCHSVDTDAKAPIHSRISSNAMYNYVCYFQTSSSSFSTTQGNNTHTIHSQHRQQQICQQLLSSPSHHHGLQPRSLTLTHTKPYSTLSPHRSLPVCAHPFHQHPRTITLTPLRAHSPLALQDLKNPSLLDKIRAKLQLPLKTNIKKDVRSICLNQSRLKCHIKAVLKVWNFFQYSRFCGSRK